MEKTPLSTIPIQSILSIFNRRATACISSFELADLSELGSATSEPICITRGHVREPTLREIEFVEEKLREEVAFVEMVIEEAVERSRIAPITTEVESRSYFDGMKMVSLEILPSISTR